MNTFLCVGAAKLAARALSKQYASSDWLRLVSASSEHTEAMAGENSFIEIVKNRQFQSLISLLPVNEI